MDKNASPKADKTPQTSPEAPFATFIQLDGKSPVPSAFRTPGTFTIVRLQSSAELPDRITKLSPVPALLVSISLRASNKTIRLPSTRRFGLISQWGYLASRTGHRSDRGSRR